tara:strand:- start:29203 stop:29391 length:189 start_codon:yes stop_codon:yes gene_type:complete
MQPGDLVSFCMRVFDKKGLEPMQRVGIVIKEMTFSYHAETLYEVLATNGKWYYPTINEMEKI